MKHLSIRFTIRTDQRTFRRCKRRLKQLDAEIAQLPFEVRERLFDLGDFSPKLIRLDLNRPPAGRTGHCRIALRLTHRYFDWLRAVRTQDFESLRVKVHETASVKMLLEGRPA